VNLWWENVNLPDIRAYELDAERLIDEADSIVANREVRRLSPAIETLKARLVADLHSCWGWAGPDGEVYDTLNLSAWEEVGAVGFERRIEAMVEYIGMVLTNRLSQDARLELAGANRESRRHPTRLPIEARPRVGQDVSGAIGPPGHEAASSPNAPNAPPVCITAPPESAPVLQAA